MNDLFEQIETLPLEVQEAIDLFNCSLCELPDIKKLETELNKYGYVFDYGLDFIPYDLRKKE
jgi:hypothetical protein